MIYQLNMVICPQDMDERPLSSLSNQRWLTWAGKSEFQMGYIWDFVRSKRRVFQHAMFDHQKVPQWNKYQAWVWVYPSFSQAHI